MANVPPRKRKRKTAGPRIAPLIPMPMVQPLSDSDWQPFLELLPTRSRSEILRRELNGLLTTYLGLLDGEAHSPSTREVATALEGVAGLAYQFARDLFTLELCVGDEKEKRFNTANEAAADILTRFTLKPEGRPVLDAAIRASEILARVAVREAKKLGEKSKKGRPTRGGANAWVLRRLIQLLRDHGLHVSVRPKSDDPVCVLSKHFLRAALTRTRTLKGSERANQEVKYALNLSDRVFAGRLRRAAEAASKG